VKILIDDGFARSRVGGVGRYTSYIVEALRLHAADTPVKYVEHGLLTGVRPTPLRRLLYSAWLDTGYSRSAQRAGGDLIHFTNYATPGRKRSSIAYAVSIHDMVAFLHPGTKSSRYIRYLRSTIVKSVTVADCIFALTEAAKAEIVGVLGVAPTKIRVCSVGSTLPIMEVPVQKASEGYGSDAPYLLTVGTIERRKNIDSLVYAMPAIWSVFPDMRLSIVGHAGIGSNYVVDAIKHVDPSRNRIHLVADCGDVKLASLYEGLGIPLVEAMAQGTPVVATRIPSSVEVAGDVAVLVDPVPDALADGVLRVLESSELQETMRGLGRARASTYNYARTAGELLTGYRSIMRK
jgi:glycosyltransferase involved in cell wall biosynthesis